MENSEHENKKDAFWYKQFSKLLTWKDLIIDPTKLLILNKSPDPIMKEGTERMPLEGKVFKGDTHAPHSGTATYALDVDRDGNIIEPKYFTPDISDIRIGYECETLINGIYCPYKYEMGVDLAIVESEIEDFSIRTPFLTKEQIKKEGWTPPKYEGSNYLEKGNFACNILKDNSLVIIMKDVLLNEWTERFSNGQMFLGKCPSINEFRMISKLLGI